jgi:hypothetical protein
VLGFQGKSKAASIAELIAGRKYDRALELLRAELQKRRNDPRLRLQLSDVLVLSGNAKQATDVLHALADDLALGGEAAKAIAVLKKVKALDPGRPEVEEKLAYLIAQQARPTPDPWRRARQALGRDAHPTQAPDRASPAEGQFPGDIEELSDSESDLATATTEGGGDLTEQPGEDAGAAVAAPPEAGDVEIEFDGEPPREALLALIEDVFVPGDEASRLKVAAEPSAAPVAVVATPLFRDFAIEELVEIIRGLKLRRYQAGEILTTEGEAGSSLFVLTAGSARAYVRNAAGRNALVRPLVEGDFFGEISLLTGAPRTATITAASRCELLEIDRETLDAIAQRHPHVWIVLKEFYDQRKDSTLEAAARGLPGDVPGEVRR